MKFSEGHIFLAHGIRISELLPWNRKSYLTHTILPRLSFEGYIHWLYWNSRTLSSSDVIVIIKWRHHVKLYLSVFRDFWKLIYKYKKQWWARKIINYLCEGRIEKSVPQDHSLSSLGKLCDAKQQSSGQIFLSYPHTHDSPSTHLSYMTLVISKIRSRSQNLIIYWSPPNDVFLPVSSKFGHWFQR